MEAQPPKRDNHTPSCAVCQRRKVKCDRVYPCAACTKSGLECAFPPPRHGKQSTVSTSTTNARLVSDGAGYRYVNNHLWSALSADGQVDGRSPGTSPEDRKQSDAGSRSGHAIYEDIARGKDAGSESRSFLFGNASRPASEQPSLPANHIVFLWQTYLANVDPVMKISHAPTIQPILLGQIGKPDIPDNEKVLVSAIHFISVVSLTDDQCVATLQETRHDLLKRHRGATEAALSAVGFITTTDTMVLQALIMYLAALRSLGEVQTVWSLFGLAIRIAGTIGLARDGTSFNLSPFEIEMRRRLWWGIVYFDGRMAELVGQDGDLMGNDYEAALPSNINDNDLFPNMSRLPEPHKGPSDAIHLQARILSVTVARRLQGLSGPQGTWSKLRDGTMSTREKLDIMHHIEQRYNSEILEICDPSVPLQYLSINTARTFATKLRLIARIPIVDSDRDWEDATGFSENAFLLSMDLLQLQVDLWCEPMVAQWRWHWSAHFQWYALVSLLRQTRLRQAGHGVSRAWMLIQKAFEMIIPTLELGERKSLLLSGIHNLLDAAKRTQDQADSAAHSQSQTQTPVSFGHAPSMGPQPPADPIFGLDLDAIDWVEFDRLATELCQQ
ncbi:hypothetical protein DOTSEDRAFT_65001 [Dothistroma septosporum NZE10]|uniref:Zn(2)-C6 fungal-type domain-containing protein n=1 Tax=Dothistroma septosporum (strain NZE10 / CBS 128990) TaxID=675120 RepID=N1PI06_DOTSN|nr:hypothetical protein DOTSEDRAFT_65001 [Dothistroma septosporum NZE10]